MQSAGNIVTFYRNFSNKTTRNRCVFTNNLIRSAVKEIIPSVRELTSESIMHRNTNEDFVLKAEEEGKQHNPCLRRETKLNLKYIVWRKQCAMLTESLQFMHDSKSIVDRTVNNGQQHSVRQLTLITGSRKPQTSVAQFDLSVTIRSHLTSFSVSRDV
jgi:hypothetical protein